MNQQIFSFFQRLEYMIVSPITGVVEHADFRETEGGGGSKEMRASPITLQSSLKRSLAIFL